MPSAKTIIPVLPPFSRKKKLAANPCIFQKRSDNYKFQLTTQCLVLKFIPGDPNHLAYGYSNFSVVFSSVFDNRLQYNDCAPDAVNAVSASIGGDFFPVQDPTWKDAPSVQGRYFDRQRLQRECIFKENCVSIQ
jgi:hypothetical protein